MLYLTFIVNMLSGFVISLIVVSYLFLYTPLKRKNLVVYAHRGKCRARFRLSLDGFAARGALTGEAWVLFTILFLWQAATLSRNRLYLS